MTEIRVEKGRLRKGPLILVGVLLAVAALIGVAVIWERIAERLPKGDTTIVTTIHRQGRPELKVEKLIPRLQRSDPKKILETFGGPKPDKGGKINFSLDIWCTLQRDESKGENGTRSDCRDLTAISTLEKTRLRQRLLETSGVTADDLPPALRR